MQISEYEKNILNKEEKLEVAKKILDKVKDNQVIGFGSGTTAFLTAKMIGEKVKQEGINITAIPTSEIILQVCKNYNIKIGSLNENKIDFSFDGADEVDKENRMIKGMGAAMFKEKLNIINSPITYILVDKTKFVEKLGEKHPIPVEVFPMAEKYVEEQMKKLGAYKITFRGKTENDNIILDCWFNEIKNELENKIKSISGVIESGLFVDYKIEVIH